MFSLLHFRPLAFSASFAQALLSPNIDTSSLCKHLKHRHLELQSSASYLSRTAVFTMAGEATKESGGFLDRPITNKNKVPEYIKQIQAAKATGKFTFQAGRYVSIRISMRLWS